MEKEEFPIIISPNLGCPKLISIKEVFSWDEIPKNDSRLKKFLIQKFGVGWVRTAKTEKIDNGKTLIVSIKEKSLSLLLDIEKNIVNLKIDDGRTYELKAEKENGNLKIYDISISIILAGQYGEFTRPTKDMFNNALKLVPSFPEDFPDKKREIILDIEEDITEITSWSQLFDFADPEETQRLINSEIHYKILGEGTKYWIIKVVPRIKNEKSLGSFMKTGAKNKSIPTLYDIVFIDDKSEKNKNKINYHAVQFVESFDKCLNFIHLTDLHVAQRNDDILGEVLKKSETGIRKREEIIKNFINFNDNLRKFIFAANKMRDKGELDFIIITGDIVDFSGLGWDERIIPDENNWKVFIDIITGQGTESKRFFKLQTEDIKEEHNSGLRVAIYTTTGNHDWRLHPYGLLPLRILSKELQPGKNGEYGLNEEEAINYNYKSFDSSEYPGDDRQKMADALMKESLDLLNGDALKSSWPVRMMKKFGWLLENLTKVTIASSFAGLIGAILFLKDKIFNLSSTSNLESIPTILDSIRIIFSIPINLFVLFVAVFILALFAVLPWALTLIAKRYLKSFIDLAVDNPIHAEARSLHYYFTHINPYFDYAFSLGNNYFVLMDTGADVAALKADNLKAKVEPKYLKKLSIQDNFIGSSPDSMSFDDRQSFYNWEQIVWLDKVLTAISKKKQTAGKGRIFIGLHAPPVNYDTHEKKKLFDLRESETRTYIKAKKEESVWVKLNIFKKSEPKEDDEKSLYLTYGTINHYLSQFFFMCMGYHENPDRKNDLISMQLLFNWGKIPGDDEAKLIDFLITKFDFEWVRTSRIDKIDGGNTIKVTGEENGKEKLVTLKLINEKKIYLEIDKLKIDELIVKTENSDLNIYSVQNLKTVDLIFSGHAHIDVEFRLGIEETHKKNEIRIYHDKYSDDEIYPYFDKNKPVIVQTASCGPPSEDDKKPISEVQIDKNKEPFVEFDKNRLPHWRTVRVNKKNYITGFKHENMDEWLRNNN